MKVVIDIPDKVYGVLKYFEESMGLSGKKEDENDDVKKTLIRAVVNGTPLPKGHGRLIDADALEKDMVNGIKSGLYEEGYETFAHINDMDDCVECVKYADTIIEAERTDKE